MAAPRHLGRLPPDHVEPVDPASVGLLADQHAAPDHGSTRITPASLDPAEIDRAAQQFAGRLARKECDIAEPALAAIIDVRQAGDRADLPGPRVDELHRARLLGDEQHRRSGREGQRPGFVERAQAGGVERGALRGVLRRHRHRAIGAVPSGGAVAACQDEGGCGKKEATHGQGFRLFASHLVSDRALRKGARIAGVDEAGRGPLAGPVVAAAVILCDPVPEGIGDSKALSPARRAELERAIRRHCVFGVGQADVAEIDALNIFHATMLAMSRAVEALCRRSGADPSDCMIDGNLTPAGRCASWRWPARAVGRRGCQRTGDRRGEHPCQGTSRPADARRFGPLAGLWLGAQQGLCHGRASRGAGTLWPPARCTGAASRRSREAPTCSVGPPVATGRRARLAPRLPE